MGWVIRRRRRRKPRFRPEANNKPYYGNGPLRCDYCGSSSVAYTGFSKCPHCGLLLCSFHIKPKDHSCFAFDWAGMKKKEYQENERMYAQWRQEKDNKSNLFAYAVIFFVILAVVLVALLNYGNFQLPKCADGTIFGFCSDNKPYLCSNGILLYSPERCGCPDGQIIANAVCEIPKNCSDGTIHNSCSLTKPFFCYDGNLSSNAALCGCPENSMLNGNECDDVGLMIHNLINSERASYNLPVLSFDDKLASIARAHSKDMSQRDYFSHFTPEGLDPTARGSAAGYSCYKNFGSYYSVGIAENIFKTYTYTSIWYTNGIETSKDYQTANALAQQVVSGWMASPGHRQNILTATYDSEGIGVYISGDGEVLVTEDFC